jgi:hypothetical protein
MAKKQVYELLFSYEAPDIKQSESAGKLVSKFFKEGEKIIADTYGEDKIIVDERYVFPLDYVQKTEEFPYLKQDSSLNETIDRIKVQSIMMSEKEAEKLDEFGKNAKSIVEGRKAKEVKEEAKRYKNGALIGLGCGLLTALYFKKNIWIFSLLGVAIGGYIAHNINKAKKGNNVIEKV